MRFALGILKIGSGLLAALGNYFVADALALSERGHPRALHRTNVNEDVARSIGWCDETKALLGIKKFNSTYSHSDLLVVLTKPHARSSDEGRNSRVLGGDLNCPKRGHSKQDQKLVGENIIGRSTTPNKDGLELRRIANSTV